MADEEKSETRKSSVLRNNGLPAEKDGSLLAFLKDRGFVPQAQDNRDIKDVSKRISDFHASFLNKTDKILKGIGKSVSVAMSPKDENGGDRRANVNLVTVQDFSDEALKRLNIGKKTEEIKPEVAEEKDFDFMKNLYKYAIPLLAAGGAFYAAINQIGKDPSTHGMMNIFAKVFGAIGGMLIKSMGLLKIPTNIFNSLFPKIFTKSGIVGGFIHSIFKNIFGRGGAMLYGAKGASRIQGARMGLGIMGKLGKYLFKWFPLGGLAISWYSGYKRYQRGDNMGAMIDFLAGIAYMVPGYGTAIGVALDVLNALSDRRQASDPKIKSKSGAIGAMFDDLLSFVGQKFMDWFDAGLQHIVDFLYASDIPNWALDKALVGLGMSRFIAARGGLIKSAEGDVVKTNKKIGKTILTLEELKEERGEFSDDATHARAQYLDRRIREEQAKLLQLQATRDEQITKLGEMTQNRAKMIEDGEKWKKRYKESDEKGKQEMVQESRDLLTDALMENTEAVRESKGQQPLPFSVTHGGQQFVNYILGQESQAKTNRNNAIANAP